MYSVFYIKGFEVDVIDKTFVPFFKKRKGGSGIGSIL